MTITITAFENAPDRGRGLARDMRVRWALEELGLSYATRLLSFDALKAPDHLAFHPFGQIPSFEQDGLVLFESGAIVLHLARHHPGLLPDQGDARARAVAWIFAALNTLEPPIVECTMSLLFERERPWFAERQPMLDQRVRDRLQQLSDRLGCDEWLDGSFSAGDLMMVTVLRRLGSTHLLDAFPNLLAYIARGEARPAYRQAFADQLAVFEAASSATKPTADR